MRDKEKFTPQFETAKAPEAEPRERHMAYGSERFESVASNKCYQKKAKFFAKQSSKDSQTRFLKILDEGGIETRQQTNARF